MEQDEQQLPNSGQNLQDKGKSLSAKSRQKKSESQESKERLFQSQGSPIGSVKDLEEKTNSLEKENENSSVAKEKNPLPVPKPFQSVDRQREALKRLQVKAEELEKAPKITSLLKKAKGGLKATLAAMRFVQGDEVIAAFLSKYDSIPKGDRDHLPWEAIGLSAGLDLRALLGSAALAITNYCGNESRIIAVSNHPAITRARVKFGKTLVGAEKDRTALDMMVGALPSPKGPTFIGKAIFGSGSAQNVPSGGGNDSDDDEPTAMFGAEDDLDQLFPPANAMQEKLINIRQKLLTEG